MEDAPVVIRARRNTLDLKMNVLGPIDVLASGRFLSGGLNGHA
jgi:hypothetical protein